MHLLIMTIIINNNQLDKKMHPPAIRLTGSSKTRRSAVQRK